ncbi:hypothetical protein FRB97_000872 [Tulasnella sp. 331]|nr:hypothetical protein FRB97_000872 [Tulasnella sp. 331]KAG8886679.1 hypothetical protein FRB98_001137 [Tulasnella sp. 332]
MSLRPPSTSPSPSPGPHNSNSRASLQPPPRGAAAAAGLAPISTRSNVSSAARPTSELLGVGSTNFQTPEAEALDQWFENLQNYEATLEEMAAASLDINFKEELSAIEQWFRVLSEAERTAALYSLIQHSTQVQIRFFITVLQQMARSDPMTALLSPAVGSSMQSQMDARLASMGLKSPGLPGSPAVRSFSAGSGPAGVSTRQSVGGADPSSFLSPESANNNAGGDAASTLAQQRARLKANAAHRISAPGTLTSESGRPATIWSQTSLTQVVERAPSPASDLSPSSASSNIRPKSTDFTGVANQFARSPRPNAASVTTDRDGVAEIDLTMQDMRVTDQMSPMVGGSWASMVNTPMVPMFTEGNAIGGGSHSNLDSAAVKLSNWSMGNGSGRVVLDDAKKFRRDSRGNPERSSSLEQHESGHNNNNSNQGGRNASGNNASNNPRNMNGGWRSPALSNVSSSRYQESDSAFSGTNNNHGGNGGNLGGMGGPMGGLNSANSNSSFGAGLSGLSGGQFGSGGLGSPGMGLGMNALAGYGGGNFGMLNNMNGMGGMGMGMGSGMNAAAVMGIQPGSIEAQILAAQLSGQLNGAFSPGMNSGFSAMGSLGGMGMNMGVQGQPGGLAGGRGQNRGLGPKTAMSSGRSNAGSNSGATVSKDPDDIDPEVLKDVPTWLRSLRLHKYTTNFESMNWKEMVVMDDAALEKQGVAALGARRKLLKHFEAVRNKMGIEHPKGFTATASDAGDD